MRRAVLLTASLALVIALGLPATGVAKKKKGGGGTVDITKVVNQPLPQAVNSTVTPINSTIDVGKQFQGKQIRDVNATVQTTGVDVGMGTFPTAAFDVEARLTAPNGATTTLFGPFALGGNSVGPFTLDDEARLFPSTGDRVDPDALYDPYIGSATPAAPLAVMDGGPVRGTWTITVTDFPFFFSEGGTNTFVLWKLNVTAGRPFKTK